MRPTVADVMEATAMDLLVAFSPTTVFTCSDEITMVFPPIQRDPREGSEEVGPLYAEASFGGKVQKLASVTAGYASVCFDRHMRDQVFDPATEAEVRYGTINENSRSNIYKESDVFVHS
jgi:tRNA(His) guanylyltransferase